MKKKTPEHIRNRIKKLTEENKSRQKRRSCREIARELGISAMTVSRIAREKF